MKKIDSGIVGLNPLLYGGINENSITSIIGASGAGKTTFATQFLRCGVESGGDGLFVTMDENKDHIILEAEKMGWENIYDYIDDKKLTFLDAGGRKFSEFIRNELPEFVKYYKGESPRISIDPLTPVIWAVDDKYEQRELLALMFNELRKIGTVVCTLEEHNIDGKLTGDEITIPMYLSDCVIHLRYVPSPHPTGRVAEIIKCRNSAHSRNAFSYWIIKGVGIVIESSEYPEPIGIADIKKLTTNMLKEIENYPPLLKNRLKIVLENLIETKLTEKEIKKIISLIAAQYMSEK